MKLFHGMLALSLVTPISVVAQEFHGSVTLSGTRGLYGAGVMTEEGNDDPGYVLYKSGYNMVLNEQWHEARSIFQELARSFPESHYRDDALYWFGYCGSQTNELIEAIDAYNRLILEFPGSQYYDDAIADLTEAQTLMQIEELSRELERSGGMLGEQQATMHERDVERQLKRLTWNRHVFPRTGYAETDPETQLRVDALSALNPDAGDKASFETLKEVALDQANPVVLREHAVHIISDAEADLALPVFVTLAKEDTNLTLRLLSLDYLAQVPGDKSVEALIEVFHDVPPQQAELSARVFYTIAEVGNDRAVEFAIAARRP